MELIKYSPETSISSSRLVQESINLGQGASAYGALAAFIDTNIAQIDQLAEFLSDQIAQRTTVAQYDKQYFDKNAKFKSFLTRNIYLNKNKVEKMQTERLLGSFLIRTAAETAMKYGARAIGRYANDKDVFITCEQIYSVLVAYIKNNVRQNVNVNRAKVELNKIRNSFPISQEKKKKIAQKYTITSVSIESIDTSSIISNNETVKNAVAYFLSVLRRQLYGANSSNDMSVLDYYSLIDINGHYGKELSTENEYQYDCIAADQTAYLQLSRGIMKNLFNNSPHIDLNKIFKRSEELAKYDPYTIRRKKIKGVAKGGVITIGSIITENPELALSGLSTALSQFTQSDEVLQLSKDVMKKWGIGGNEFDMISEDANSILLKNQDNDMNNYGLS